MVKVFIFMNNITCGNTYVMLFTPQPLRAVGVLFSPIVSGWEGGRAGGGK